MRLSAESALLLFVAAFAFSAISAEDELQFFEDIATQHYEVRDTYPMEQIYPPKLPAKPVFKYNGGKAFTPLKKATTKAEVDQVVADLKKKYAPFMKDLTPPFQTPRIRVNVTKAQFRYEAPEDQKDFTYTLSGKGTWKNVKIPCYHGPMGPSTAYYRMEVDVDKKMMAADIVMLHFKGADYYCDAYVNGHFIGFHEGMTDPFEFNTKPYLKEGKNVILVRLRNDYSTLGAKGGRQWRGDKIAAYNGPGWNDPDHGWFCCPVGYGIYQGLYLETRSEPFISDIFPRPMLSNKGNKVQVWAEIDLPDGNRLRDCAVRVKVLGQNFKDESIPTVTFPRLPVKGKEGRVIGSRCIFRPEITIPNARLWTPEKPWLYQARVELIDAKTGKVLDAMKRQFGMRSFIISQTSKPKGRLYLNGKEIRLRGTNTMGYLQQDVLRGDFDQLTYDLLMTKATNLNFIRTTQRSLQEEVYDYADKLGIMMQSDLPLFAHLTPKQFTEAISQAGRMVRYLRSHPSFIIMTFINEPSGKGFSSIARPELERLFDAAEIVVRHEDPDCAIKYVDGDYQPPNKGLLDKHTYNIWYHGHNGALEFVLRGGWRSTKIGWMYGCGEFGSDGLDPVKLMLKYYPDKWLPKDKNPDNPWSPDIIKTDTGGNECGNISPKWFEWQDTMTNWVKASHQNQVWGLKRLSEAFRRMPRLCTCAVHLLINAWPNGWLMSLVDYDRTPLPAWYAFRDAMAPLVVQIFAERTLLNSGETYNTQVWICNDTHTQPDVELRYQLKMNGKALKTGNHPGVVPSISDGSKFQGYLPIIAPKVDKRSTLVAQIGMFDKKTGKLLNNYTQTFTVFPETPKRSGTIEVVGKATPAAKDLAKKFGLEIKKDGEPAPESIIMVTDYKAYDSQRDKIDQAVKNGAKALFVCKLPEKARVADVDISSIPHKKKRGRDISYWFVGRNKNHWALRNTDSYDFKYWYNDIKCAPKQFTFNTFKKNKMTPVLRTRYKNNHVEVLVAEETFGKGRVIVWDTDLAGMLINPPCKLLLDNLLFKGPAK